MFLAHSVSILQIELEVFGDAFEFYYYFDFTEFEDAININVYKRADSKLNYFEITARIRG